MIKVLEVLENNFPYDVNLQKLGDEMNAKELRITVKAIEPIIEYLKKSDKISVRYESSIPGMFGGAEEISILPQGIDFLSKIKEMEIGEKRNGAIMKATVVLALAASVQALVYFKQFSEGAISIYDLMGLVAMGVMVIIIFTIAWGSYTDLLNLHKK